MYGSDGLNVTSSERLNGDGDNSQLATSQATTDKSDISDGQSGDVGKNDEKKQKQNDAKSVKSVPAKRFCLSYGCHQ